MRVLTQVATCVNSFCNCFDGPKLYGLQPQTWNFLGLKPWRREIVKRALKKSFQIRLQVFYLDLTHKMGVVEFFRIAYERVFFL